MPTVNLHTTAIDVFGLAGTVNLHALALEVFGPFDSTVNVHSLAVDVFGPSTADASIHGVALEVFRSIYDGWRPSLADASPPIELSQARSVNLMRPAFIPASAAIPLASYRQDSGLPNLPAEFNPYRPDVPAAESPELFDYLRHQAETIREQHNLLQAGDTTFPHELIYQISETQQFTLGSLTRFYHPDYGILEGRYVRFGESLERGVFAAKSADQEWAAVSAAGTYDIIGLVVSLNIRAGAYGWLQVSGIALESLDLAAETPTLGVPFAWDPVESVVAYIPGVAVGAYTAGGVIGEIFAATGPAFDPRRWRIDVGGVRLHIGGVTPATATEQLAPQISTINDRLDSVESRLDDEVVDYGPAIDALSGRVDSTNDRLTNESNTRARTDTQLLRRIRALETTLVETPIPPPTDLINLSVRLSAIEDVTVPRINALNNDTATLLGITDTHKVRLGVLDTQVAQLAALASLVPADGGGSLPLVTSTPTLQLVNDTLGEPIRVPLAPENVPVNIANYLQLGTLANRPASPVAPPSTVIVYFATDTLQTFVWVEGTWQPIGF